jgi:AraC-like DNA-binding protein
MMKAKSLLLDSTMSITRIAGELGLSSFSHFSHVFREETGMTPGEYRRSGGRIYQGE